MELGPTKTITVTHANPKSRPDANRSTTSDEPVVDHDVPDALASVIGRRKVDRFIADFIDHAGMHRRHMRKALTTDDFDRLYRSAHMLVAVSGNLGAVQVSHLCDRLQRAAAVSDAAAAHDMFDDVDLAIDQALDVMAAMIA